MRISELDGSMIRYLICDYSIHLPSSMLCSAWELSLSHCACFAFLQSYMSLASSPSPFYGLRTRQSSVMPSNTLEWSGLLVTVSLWRTWAPGKFSLGDLDAGVQAAGLNIFQFIPSLLSQPLCFLSSLSPAQVLKGSPGEAG